MLMGQNNALLEEDVAAIEEKDLRNRAKYIQRCKDNLWKRWTSKYLKGLRERHNLKHGGKEHKHRRCSSNKGRGKEPGMLKHRNSERVD